MPDEAAKSDENTEAVEMSAKTAEDSTEDSDTAIKAMEDIKTSEASEAETKKDAKEVVTKTDEIPMEDINIKDTNATKIQDFSTKMKTIDNDNTISMDVAATKDTKEADEETEITFKSNQDIKEVDVPEKAEEKTEKKALKKDDVSIQSDEYNKKNVTGENALSDQEMESRRPRIKKIPRRLKSLKQLMPRLSRILKGLMSPMILRL